MKKIFTLIAACVLGVMGAWAADIEWETVWSADFSSAPTGMTYSVTSGNTDISKGYLIYNQGGGSGDRAIKTAFTSTAFNVDTAWKMEFDIAFGSSNTNTSNVSFATNKGAVFTATWIKYASAVVVTDASSTELTNTLPLEGYKVTTMGKKSHVILTGDPDKGIYLTITQGSTTYVNNVLATTTFGYPSTFNGSLGKTVSAMMLDNIVFQTPKVAGFVAAPTFNVIGANGNARILTLATITEGASMKWSETAPAEDETFESWTAYNTSLSTSASTIYAVAIKGTDKSEVTTIETGAGSTLSLVAPVASVTLNNGVPTYSFVSNNSSVLGAPSATLTAKLNDEVVSLIGNSLTPSTKGTLVVTASATGYADASTTIPVSDLFAPVWSSADYSTLTVDNAQSVLGDNWKMSTGGRWASWNSGNEPYTYFGDGSSNNIDVEENLRMRGVISLVLGYGLGRNITGSEAITMNNMQEGYIAAYRMYNGFGSHAAAESNYTSYVIATGTSTSVNTNNGSLLIQAVMYAPVPEKVNVAVNASGTASYVTPCALDFTDSKLKAYIATAVSETAITLEEVKTVAAGQAIVVKGETCDVNVIASAAAPEVNLFQSGAKTVGADENVFALYTEDGQFHKVAEGVAIPAGKAYIVAAAGTSAKTLALNFGGEATGIINATVAKQNAAAFNLMGQKVSANAKGIVIINGKKFNNK